MKKLYEIANFILDLRNIKNFLVLNKFWKELN